MNTKIKDMTSSELNKEEQRVRSRLALLRKIANGYRRRLGAITTRRKGKEIQYAKLD
jgi:hypothetical protein